MCAIETVVFIVLLSKEHVKYIETTAILKNLIKCSPNQKIIKTTYIEFIIYILHIF